MSAGKSSIIFCATQRTGSTVVVDDLSNVCGVASFNPEMLYDRLLRGDERASWEVAWRAVAKQCRVHGHSVSKVMFHYLPHLATAISGGTVGDPSPVYSFAPVRCDAFYDFFRESIWVYVRRRDVFAQAVSMYFAQITDQWELRDPQTKEKPSGQPWVPYDRERLMRYVRAFSLENAGWEALFAHYGFEPIRIVYEDTIGCYPTYLDEVLRRMGVGHVNAPPRRMIKQGDAINDRYADALRRDVMDHPILRSMVA